MAAVGQRLSLNRNMDIGNHSNSSTSDRVTRADVNQNCAPLLVSTKALPWTGLSGVHSQTMGCFGQHAMSAFGQTMTRPLVSVASSPPKPVTSVTSGRRASNPKFLSSLMQVESPVGQQHGRVSVPIIRDSAKCNSVRGDDSTFCAAPVGRSPIACVPSWLSGHPGHYGAATPRYYGMPFGWEAGHSMAAPWPPVSPDINTSVSHDRPLDLSRSSVKKERLHDDRVVKSSKSDSSDIQQSVHVVSDVNSVNIASPVVSASFSQRTVCGSSALSAQARGCSLDSDVKCHRLYTPVATFPPAALSSVSPRIPVTLADTVSLTNAYSTATTMTKSAFRTVKTSPIPPLPLTPPGGSNIRMKEMLVYENRLLQLEFQERVASGNDVGVATATGSSAQQLQKLYQESVDRVETERFQTLRGSQSEAEREQVHSHYDQLRLLLLRDIKHMLHSGVTTTSSLTAPPMVAMATASDGHHIHPLVDGSNVNHSYPVELTSPDYFIGRGAKRKYLHQGAVCVLNAWYEQHFDHPYPEDDAVEILAANAGISASQVKKWMANKRVRSCNTLAFNGSIHPKKLQKLLQLKDCPPTPPPEPRCNVETPPSEKHARSKRMLDPSAVGFMNQWYYEHQAYPYPTEGEKRCIASATGVTAAQVTCWFANKRNRSHNTRRLSAAHMLHKLNRKLQIYNTMQRNRLSTSTSCDRMSANQTLTHVN